MNALILLLAIGACEVDPEAHGYDYSLKIKAAEDLRVYYHEEHRHLILVKDGCVDYVSEQVEDIKLKDWGSLP